MPDVSVLTPSFGYGRFIRDALSSVRGQVGVDVEHIVQDAGSTDETIDVLRKFGDEVEWRSEPDRGQSDALNRAFERSEGRWIAWLNADEFYLPQGLEALVQAGERSATDVVYADAAFIDEGGTLIRLLASHRFSPSVLRQYGPFIGSCTVLLRRSALGECPWDVDVRRIMDWELYLRLLSEGARFIHVPYPVGAYRIHGGQVTAQPGEEFSEDHRTVRARYGIRLTGRGPHYAVGRGLHGVHKLLSGARRRERHAQELRGGDLRWFNPRVGRAAVDELLRRCYGVPGANARGKSGTAR